MSQWATLCGRPGAWYWCSLSGRSSAGTSCMASPRTQTNRPSLVSTRTTISTPYSTRWQPPSLTVSSRPHDQITPTAFRPHSGVLLNTNLVAKPSGITSNFSSRTFSVSAPFVWNSLPALSLCQQIINLPTPTTVCPKKVSPLTFCNNNRKSAPI